MWEERMLSMAAHLNRGNASPCWICQNQFLQHRYNEITEENDYYNLNVDEKLHHRNFFRVACHHWTLEEIEYMKCERNISWAKLITVAEAQTKFNISADSYYVLRNRRGKQLKLMCLRPHHSRSEIEKIIKSCEVKIRGKSMLLPSKATIKKAKLTKQAQEDDREFRHRKLQHA